MATKKRKATTAKKVAPRSASLASEKRSQRRKITFTRNKLIIAVALVVVLALLYFFRGFFVVATVNGEPISRFALDRELEGRLGQEVLPAFVAKTIIYQGMKKENIKVTNEEVDNEIKKIEKALSAQGLTLEDALRQQKMTKEGLIDKIRIQKMIEKLFGKGVKVSEKEIDKYIEDNRETLTEATNSAELAAQRSEVKQQLLEQKLSEKFQKWLSPLQEKAKINYFVNF